jgi:uncharacterized protein YgiB involved in biofilm formation
MSKDVKSAPKRSRQVVLTTLTAGAGTMALTACGGDTWEVEGQVFETVAQCTAAGVAANECQDAYNQALADNQNDAPRFESQDLCEGEFGQGQCQQQFAGGGGGTGSFWVPLLSGFVIGNALGEIDIDGRKRKYAPVYRSRAHNAYYHGGSNYGPMPQTSNGRYGMPRATFDRPVSSPRVQTRADIASRGGFGGRVGGRSGSGG